MSDDRTPIDALLDAVDWTPAGPPPTDPGGLPYAIHEGVLEIMGYSFRVYQLSDGRRIVHAEDVERFFGGMAGTGADAAGGGS